MLLNKAKALFRRIRDQRVQGRTKYPLYAILIIALLAILAGCKGWVAIAQFAQRRRAYLSTILPCLRHGTPNCDTIARTLAKVDVNELNSAFSKLSLAIFRSVVKFPVGRPPKKKRFWPVIGLDGKTAKGSVQRGFKKSFVHIVNAACTLITLVVHRVKEKSNEITAYPIVIKALHQMGLLSHCVITIDAMGCQKSIASLVISLGGNWLFSLKGNQEKIHDSVKRLFADMDAMTAFKDCFTKETFVSDVKDTGGRIATYVVTVIHLNVQKAAKYMAELNDWDGIKTLVMVERSVDGHMVKGEWVEASREDPRYYISSLDIAAEAMHKTILAHWGVEVVHNQLDVTFLEDKCRIWRGSCAEVFSTMRKLALNIFNSIRWFWDKESVPMLIELFRDNTTFQKAVLEKPPDKVGNPETWRKLMGEVNWGAGCPDPASVAEAA